MSLLTIYLPIHSYDPCYMLYSLLTRSALVLKCVVVSAAFSIIIIIQYVLSWHRYYIMHMVVNEELTENDVLSFLQWVLGTAVRGALLREVFGGGDLSEHMLL